MKRNKILALIAGVSILFGIVCSGIIIVQGIQTGTFSAPVPNKSERYPQAWELEKTKLDEFSEISIALSYCDFSILPSDGYYLEYHMDGTCEKPQYDVSNDSFHFQEGRILNQYRTNFSLFFNHRNFSANQGPYYVNLYVPTEQYFRLLSISDESGTIKICNIEAENADITAEFGTLEMDDFSGKKLSIQADSGNIEMGTITCDNLDIANEYGNISADSFLVTKNTTITLDSGNLELSKLKSDQLALSNEYGNCTIDDITIANSSISMDSGSLRLRRATLGNTEINNSYGDVNLSLASGVNDYNYDLQAEYGSVRIDGKNIEANEDGEVSYQKDNDKNDEIRIICESGNIKIH